MQQSFPAPVVTVLWLRSHVKDPAIDVAHVAPYHGHHRAGFASGVIARPGRKIAEAREASMAWRVGAGLDGQGVIVTGAAGGIGRHVATAFAAVGARVMAVDMQQESVEEIVTGLEGAGHVAVAADLTDLAGQAALVARARAEFGSLDVLASLAAVLRRRPDVDD